MAIYHLVGDFCRYNFFFKKGQNAFFRNFSGLVFVVSKAGCMAKAERMSIIVYRDGNLGSLFLYGEKGYTGTARLSIK